jgi:hypothetical protein
MGLFNHLRPPQLAQPPDFPWTKAVAMIDSRAKSTPADKKHGECETDSLPEVGIEKHAPKETLQRQASGPPYSIFSSRMKAWIIFLVSISALISPFGATTVLPALNVLTDVLDITPSKANISITTYMVSSFGGGDLCKADFGRSLKPLHLLSSVLCRTPMAGDYLLFSAMSSTLLPTSDSHFRPTM